MALPSGVAVMYASGAQGTGGKSGTKDRGLGIGGHQWEDGKTCDNISLCKRAK